MADLNKMYRDLIEDLDRNIKDEKELKNIKGKMFDLMTYFMESNNSIIGIKDKQEKLEKYIKKMQRRLEKIEEDIYIEEDDDDFCGDKMHDNDYEFEIRCPYCDYDFIISEESQATDEIECPQCHNIIELDWDDASECAKDCKSCKQHCYQDEEEKDSQVEQLSEENEEYKPDNNEKNNIKDNTNDPKNNENQNNANNIQDFM